MAITVTQPEIPQRKLAADVSMLMARQPPIASRKNLLINGNFDLWRRGVSQTTNAYGSADNWYRSASGSTGSLSRQAFEFGQTDVPGNPAYALRATVTTNNAINSLFSFLQRIESVLTGSNEKLTVSFWANVDRNNKVGIEFIQNYGSGGSAGTLSIGSIPVQLTPGWKKYHVTIALPSIEGKTIGAGHYLGLIFYLDAGSDRDDRTGGIGNQSGVFDFAQIQAERADEPSEFELRTAAEELQLAKRYLHVYGGQSLSELVALGYSNSTTQIRYVFPLSVEMRVTPSFEYSALGDWSIPGLGSPTNMVLYGHDSTNVVTIVCTTAGHTQNLPFVLNANNTLNSRIYFSAEL